MNKNTNPHYEADEKDYRRRILRLLLKNRSQNHILLSGKAEVTLGFSPFYVAIHNDLSIIVSTMLNCIDESERQKIVKSTLLQVDGED